jgi:hypothetical protein
MWEVRRPQDPRVTPAQRASGTAAPYTVQAWVENASSSPIYDVTFRWHRGTAPAGQSQTFSSLQPGQKQSVFAQLPEDVPATVDRLLFGAVVYFRDSNRVGWRLRPDGQLDPIPGQQMPVPDGEPL